MFSLVRNFSKVKISPFLNIGRSLNNKNNQNNLVYISKFFFGQKQKPNLKIHQEKWQRMNQNRQSKKYGYMQIALYGLVFACCFAAIPAYRVFCERVGLVGNYDKKQYKFTADQIKNVRKYKVKFQGQAQPGINWQFDSVQKQVTVGVGQTAIVFYRLHNKEDYPIVGFSTYNISPQEVNVYFSKIQCFCFNQQMVNPQEQLLLPLFFYLQPELADDPDVGRIRDITVHYQFVKSNKQDLAKFAEEQLRRVQENKRKLNSIRAKKQNLSLKEYQSRIEKQAEETMIKNMRQMVEQQKKRQQYQKQSKSKQQIERNSKNLEIQQNSKNLEIQQIKTAQSNQNKRTLGLQSAQ